jgi:hypothetical protein
MKKAKSYNERPSKKVFLKPSFLKIWIPASLLFITIACGWLGAGDSLFSKNSLTAFWRSFGNLLGEANFKDLDFHSSDSTKQIPILIWISKIAGLIFIASAIILVLQDIYVERFTKLRIKLWLLTQPKKPIVIVCGLGWRGFTLTQKLIQQNNNVIGIDVDTDQGHIQDLKQMGALIFNGDATSRETLTNASILKASEIYALTNNEEINCRIAAQIEQITVDDNKKKNIKPTVHNCIQLPEGEEGKFIPKKHCCKHKPTRQLCYVSVDTSKYGRGLEDIIREDNDFWTSRFSANEITIYELFRKQGIAPMDVEGGTHINIFGYTPISKSLLIASLQMMHFRKEQNKNRLITVYSEDPQKDQTDFYNEYPGITKSKNGNSNPHLVLPEIHFVAMPKSEFTLHDEGLELYLHMNDESWRVNTYFCIDDGIQSLGLIKSINEKLTKLFNSEKQRLFISCYYSYPETLETYTSLPHNNSGSTKETEIQYFGKQSSPEFYKSSKTELLAKRVLEFYEFMDLELKNSLSSLQNKTCYIEEKWVHTKEWERHACRMAANHFFVKLDLLSEMEKSEILDLITAKEKDSLKSEINVEKELMKNELFRELAEIEHNRWWAEKLIRGYRYLDNPEEIKKWETNKAYRKYLKDNLWHKDMKPFNKLNHDIQAIDGQILRVLPKAINYL